MLAASARPYHRILWISRAGADLEEPATSHQATSQKPYNIGHWTDGLTETGNHN